MNGTGDGKITGVTSAMEYSADNGSTWTACAESEVTELTPGNYQVRIKSVAGTSFASLATNVIIASGTAQTCVLNIVVPTFESVAEGYTQPAA
jgi:Neuraminidase (sialidase)